MWRVLSNIPNLMQCSLFWKAQRKTFAFLYNKYKWYLAFGVLVLIMCHYHGYHALFITLPKAFSYYIGMEINSYVALMSFYLNKQAYFSAFICFYILMFIVNKIMPFFNSTWYVASKYVWYNSIKIIPLIRVWIKAVRVFKKWYSTTGESNQNIESIFWGKYEIRFFDFFWMPLGNKSSNYLLSNHKYFATNGNESPL